ncbi:MAG: DUF6092 family protein [Anaerolineae bacterium]
MDQSHTLLEEMDAIECIAFLLVSAGCLKDEPKDYGSMRLLAAARLLSEKIAPRASAEWKPFFDRLVTEIPDIQRVRQQDPEKYYGFIEQFSADLTRMLLERSDRPKDSQ